MAMGIVKLSKPFPEHASTTVATIENSKRITVVLFGKRKKLSSKVIKKNASEPETVFCSLPKEKVPKGYSFPTNAAAGSANAIVNIGK